jgi:predicted esterase
MKRSTLAAAAGVSVAGAALGVRAWMQRRATTALPLPGQAGQMSLVVPGFAVLERVTGQGDPQRPLPLVLVLHGVGADERQLVPYTNVTVPARLVYIRGPLAERSGFSYFAPRFKGDPKAFLAAVEDMSARMIRVLDVVASQRASSRTLLVGYSQGGHIAWMQATTGRFDVVMPISGALPADYRPLPAMGRTVIRAIHGENDKALPVSAGAATFHSFQAAGYKGSFARLRGNHALATLGQYLSSTLSNALSHDARR